MKWHSPTLVLAIASAALMLPVRGAPAETPPLPARPAPQKTVVLRAISPDGKWFAQSNRDGTIEVSTLSGRFLRFNFTGHEDGVHALVFSPDGRTLASSGLDGIKRWDLVTGCLIGKREGNGIVGPALAFSPDGTLLAAAHPNLCGTAVLDVWDLLKVTRRASYTSRAFSFGGVAFSPDGKTIATAGTGVQLWDAATGELLATLRKHDARQNNLTLAYSSDGKFLAVGYPGRCPYIELYHLASRKQVGQFFISSCETISLAFSHDSKKLAWGSGSDVCFHDLTEKPDRVGRIPDSRLKGRAVIGALTFSTDGKTVHVHRLATVEELDITRAVKVKPQQP